MTEDPAPAVKDRYGSDVDENDLDDEGESESDDESIEVRDFMLFYITEMIIRAGMDTGARARLPSRARRSEITRSVNLSERCQVFRSWRATVDV